MKLTVTRLLIPIVAPFIVWGVAACGDDGPGKKGDASSDATSPADATAADGADDAEPDSGDDAVPDGEDTAAPDGDEEALTVTDVIPGKGLTIGLEQVEIIGTGFFQGVQVFFGESLAQDIFVLNEHRLVVLTPPRGPGLVEVRVVDPDSGATSKLDAAFLYYNPVSIVEVDPPYGHVLGGERVTVTGEGFVPGSVLLFGQKAALQAQVLDDHTITGVVPDGDEVGAVDVLVSNTEGVGLLDDGFRYVDAPSITLVAPPTGPVAGGNVIEIGGKGFAEPLTVMIGGQPLGNARLVASGRITGVVPPGTRQGPVDVSVTTEFGTGARDNAYAYLDPIVGAPLELIAVSPGQGRVGGGEAVMLIARGLVSAEGIEVRFGGRLAELRTVDLPSGSLIVVAPNAAGPGKVDVELTQNAVASSLADAYEYRAGVTITGVSPGSGPAAGGTAITVVGSGFAPGLELRIGALPAASVQVQSATEIRAVTPPGSPGLADAVVIQSGAIARKDDVFEYEAPYALWVVDPPQGSQAGGTLVTLVGSGFATDSRVSFGGRAATHVTWVSPTIITCKSPPGDLGTVEVTVDSDSAGRVAQRDAFTYYDPTSTYGGTWGGDVEGDVNVTVLDGGSGAPVPDAFVMLWTDPSTPYQGFTNAQGQVTFSGTDLAGEQMVSASKPGYSRASVVEYNATNVTVYINPTTPPSPGGGGGAGDIAILRGRITNLGKAFPVPFGRCDYKWDAPGNLCGFCTEDSDCGAGYRCSEIPQQVPGGGAGNYCTTDCVGNADCPDGFMCVPLEAGAPLQCAPKLGDIQAYCDITNESIFSTDVKTDPGLQVNPDGTFEMDTDYDDGSGRQRFGDMALYCWGGVYSDDLFEFVPLVLGVERHLFVLPGDVVELEVALDQPLSRTQYVELDPVPRGLEGPDFEYIFPYIELGPDGVIDIPPQYAFGEPFVLEHFLAGLTGDLYDASFTFLAGSFPFSAQVPYTVTLHQRLTRLEDDTMFYQDGDAGAWTGLRTGVTKNVNGLFWSGDNLVGVGSKGLVVRSIGDAWATQESGVQEDLRAVHGVPGGALVAVGDLGNASRWNGLTWDKMETPVTGDLRAVWMLSDTEGWAVGSYATIQMRNGVWSEVMGNAYRNLYGVYGFAANDVWAVGASGTVLRYDGITWNVVPSNTSIGLRAVWGASDDDVWMVGEAGLVLHWDGSELTKVAVDTAQTLTAVWGRSAEDVTVVGGRGVAFHWDGTGWSKLPLGAASKNVDFLAIGGAPDADGRAVMTGSHELVLGPILAVPEQLSPGNGGFMGDDYRISWQVQPGPDPHFSYVEIAIPTLFGPVPEWTMINDFDVQSITLPDFPNIEGTPGIDPGSKYLTVFRVFKEGFDIDNYSNTDLNQFGWRSWSINQVIFTKL